jgi:hypothetical protein
MSTITAKELQTHDPKRFQQEYSKWCEYALDYDWWYWAEEQLKERLAPAGVRIDRILFSLSYSQGDYATFEGRIDLYQWMEANMYGDQTYAEKFPALHLALQDYGDYATVNTWHRNGGARVNYDANVVGNTYPSGIFSSLEQEAWDELIEEQQDMAGIEQALQDYVDGISRQLYRDLREEYEHLTSKESFIESCECNDITFETEEIEA